MRSKTRALLSFAALFAMLAPAAGNATPPIMDNAAIAGTILPPGTDHAHATAEIAPYDNLVYEYPALTEDTLFRYFKNARFGPQGTIARDYSPRAGVRILRDERWGVPHVYGDTDADAWFGAGYVSAEDRLPIMDLLRALGRGEAFELLGTTPAWFADAEWARLYGHTEEEFQEMIARLPILYGSEGDEVVLAFREFIDGVNNYVARIHAGEVALPTGYRELGRLPAPWRETDIVAVTTVIRALFGANGGTELSNLSLLAGLDATFGPSVGRQIYEDFRNRDNLDAPMHTDRPFPYMQRNPSALDPAANLQTPYSAGKRGIQQTVENVLAGNRQYTAVPTLEELTSLEADARIDWNKLVLRTPLGSLDLRPKGMSNALVIGRDRSANGKPIMLGGPQTGYFSPEILMEIDIHGRTVHARGAGFPGISMFVLLGRSADASWTATAGGSDMIDTFIEVLCEADGSPATEHSYGYLYKGKCEPMNRRLHRSLAQVPGVNLRAVPDIWVERTVHGTVLARGTVGTMPVAVTRARSSYGREVDSAVAFLRLNRNQVRTGAQFVETMGMLNLTTNWMFAGQDDIAYMHGGLFPIRKPQVDPDLPVWGTGEWDWQGFLPPTAHPQDINPPKGYITSWNNKTAPGWNAADSQFAFSSLYRSGMLDRRIEADPSITPVELVQMMEDAGLTDLRGEQVLPRALSAMGAAPAGSREATMIELLKAWVTDGARRRDSDQDGRYDHGAAIAIMDEWWPRLIEAMYNPALGDWTRMRVGLDNAPNTGGSAYQNGMYGQAYTDLTMITGGALNSPTSRTYCGGTATSSGTPTTCAQALMSSFIAAGNALEDGQGANPRTWDMDPTGERIVFLGAPPLTMHWVNRPTFQQLTQFRN